jgi:DNA-binding SARP family transcriptional activator
MNQRARGNFWEEGEADRANESIRLALIFAKACAARSLDLPCSQPNLFVTPL